MRAAFNSIEQQDLQKIGEYGSSFNFADIFKNFKPDFSSLWQGFVGADKGGKIGDVLNLSSIAEKAKAKIKEIFSGKGQTFELPAPKLGEKFKIWMIVPMFFVVWGSSKILNVPLISVYSMGIYVLHYIVVLLLGYWTVTYLHLPFIVNYLIILIGTIIILPLLIEIVKRIPILNKLVLGIK